MALKTPVVFIIFNRPETTQKVFDAIKQAQPKKLFVIADGARKNKPGEDSLCEQSRKIIEQVDWKCEIIKDYSDVNLGCKKRLSSGITRVFEQTEQAIFLEDDCLPSQSFFTYCENLLDFYQDNEKIMHIAGINFQFGKNTTEYSYYFSHFVHVWGWASWKRAWKLYDVQMRKWPEVKGSTILDDFCVNDRAKRYWTEKFQLTYDGKIDTWDYQWNFACLMNNGLSVIPNKNLVSNIGFNTGGVHTHEKKSEWAGIPINELEFPLKHPPQIIRNKNADANTQDKHFSPDFLYKLKRKIKQTLTR